MEIGIVGKIHSLGGQGGGVKEKPSMTKMCTYMQRSMVLVMSILKEEKIKRKIHL